MNYLDIINKCLSELNFRQVEDFSDLIKPEHQRIKNYINLVAQDVCSSMNWNFLLRQEELTLPAGTKTVANNIYGRILAVYIDGIKYNYCENFQLFLKYRDRGRVFSVFNDKFLFPEFEENKLINIIYYTRNLAVSAENQEKSYLEEADDKALIPEPFTEQILVYGTCLRLKGDPQHVKFSYWQDMYNAALANMRSKIAIDADYTPFVRLFRR